jgi:hypothetical protein
MNTLFAVANSDIYPANHPAGLKGILIQFLVAIVVLGIVAGLFWFIDNYIHKIPDPVKMVAAVILVIAVIIWAISIFV